jgi:hypothetical protein
LLEEIRDLEQQILELKSSQAYEDLEVSNMWDKKKQNPSDPDAEKAWIYLKKGLEHLVIKKNLIEDRFRDQGKLQSKKRYKTRAAIVSERSYLTTVPNFGTILSVYRNSAAYKIKN